MKFIIIHCNPWRKYLIKKEMFDAPSIAKAREITKKIIQKVQTCELAVLISEDNNIYHIKSENLRGRRIAKVREEDKVEYLVAIGYFDYRTDYIKDIDKIIQLMLI